MTDMDCKAEEGYKCFQYMCFPWNRFDHLSAETGDVAGADDVLFMEHLFPADVGDKEWCSKISDPVFANENE